MVGLRIGLVRGLCGAAVMISCRSAPPPPAVEEPAGAAAAADARVGGPEAAPAAGGPVTGTPFGAADPGVGVVYFRYDASPQLHDTATIHAAPDAAAPVVGRFVLHTSDGSAISGLIDAPGVEAANLLEFAYEERGLPFDSVSGDGAWRRVLPGRNAAGVMQQGWVRLRPGLQVETWRELLPERAQYALTDPIDLRREPDGAPVVFRFARNASAYPSALDHLLEPDSAAGDWLRVRVRSPSDGCGVEVSGVRDTVAWIRMLDPRGRPLVWFYARGC